MPHQHHPNVRKNSDDDEMILMFRPFILHMRPTHLCHSHRHPLINSRCASHYGHPMMESTITHDAAIAIVTATTIVFSVPFMLHFLLSNALQDKAVGPSKTL